MRFEKTTEYIYEQCAERIKLRIKESKLTLEEIHPSNPKLISLIQNNRRDETHNRFLVPPSALKYVDPNTSEEYGLIPKLNFANAQQVLWGTPTEIEGYIFPLFKTIIDELSIPENYNNEIDNILCAYAPYSFLHSYYNILFSSDNTYPAILFGVHEDSIIENIDHARRCSILYLYLECEKDILTAFTRFIDSTSFIKLPQKIEDFVDNNLMNTLNEYMSKGHALGYRVKEMIYGDLLYIPRILKKEDCDLKKPPVLINATSEYICKIEEIQRIELLQSKYSYLID